MVIRISSETGCEFGHFASMSSNCVGMDDCSVMGEVPAFLLLANAHDMMLEQEFDIQKSGCLSLMWILGAGRRCTDQGVLVAELRVDLTLSQRGSICFQTCRPLLANHCLEFGMC